jgi:large subunit ribosomal protein L25
MMAHELAAVEIECLPDRIPESIQVDISGLIEDDQSIQVKDLVLGEGVAALSNPEQVVVRIAPLRIEKVEEKPVVAEAVAEGAEGAEGAPAAEGASGEAKEGKEPKKEAKKGE